MAKENKRVAIYIRVSTLDQAREGYSLEAQEKTLRQWCNNRKYEVFELYADRGISGKDIKHRPGMNCLLQVCSFLFLRISLAKKSIRGSKGS